MADEVDKTPGNVSFLRRFVWTFVVDRGSPVEVRVRTGPPLQHKGSSTVWQAVLTTEEGERVKQTLEEAGCQVQVYRAHENPEQKVVRLKIYTAMEVGQYPTLRCPQCFFFDLHVEGFCNVEVWSQEVTDAALDQDKALKDYLACPLRENT